MLPYLEKNVFVDVVKLGLSSWEDYPELSAGPKMQSKDLKEGEKKVKDIVLRDVTVETGGWSDKRNGS